MSAIDGLFVLAGLSAVLACVFAVIAVSNALRPRPNNTITEPYPHKSAPTRHPIQEP